MIGIFKYVVMLIVCFLFLSASFAGTVYWYVDDEGVTHFGPMPTADATTSSGQYDYDDIVESQVPSNVLQNDSSNVQSDLIDSDSSYSEPGSVQDDTVYFDNQSLKRLQDNKQNDSKQYQSDKSIDSRNQEFPNQQEQASKPKKHIINLSNSPYHEEDFE